MATFLRGSNGIARSFAEATSTAIYDQSIILVVSGPTGNDLVGPITSGTPITLPASGSYTVASSVTALNVFLNGMKLDYILDWSVSGAGPTYTALSFLFDLVVTDKIELRYERAT
jgi:hypothetical protein